MCIDLVPATPTFYTSSKMDFLTPVSELSSTAEYEEECDMVGIIKADRKGDKKSNEEEESIDLKLIRKQLETENGELRSMCGYLGEVYHTNKRLALEWQCFGSYTAEILRQELKSSEIKDRMTREQLEKLAKENKELKEMCLFLDQSREAGSGGNSSLTPPEAMELMLHARVVGEINKKQGVIPQYSGLTKSSTLKDSQAIRKGVMDGINKEKAVEEMKKRIDRLEAERLELIKSLSAAHILAANTNEAASERKDVLLPPDLQSQLNSLRKTRNAVEEEAENAKVLSSKAPSSKTSSSRTPSSKTPSSRTPSSKTPSSRTPSSKTPPLHNNNEGGRKCASPEDIMNAVTLLDVIRRVDAATVGGFSDGKTEGEAVALRLLINIAWQKMQEKFK